DANSALSVQLIETREQLARAESALALLDRELAVLRERGAEPAEVSAVTAAVAESASDDAARAQIEALEQRLWERERLAAARGRELTDLRVQLAIQGRTNHEAMQALMSSASWRLTLPLRAVRHPRYYLRTLRNRRTS